MIEIFCTSFYHVVDKTAVRYSIANSAPALFRSMPVVSLFIPAIDLVKDYKNNRITWEQYTKVYVDVLRMKYRSEVSSMMHTLSKTQQGNIELCCWENKSHPHCHRAIVADIINKTVAFEKIDNIKASVHDLNGAL